MDLLEFSTAEREALPYGRFHHPPPRVQLKMAALYLKSQGVSAADGCRLCGISKPTWYRSLREYRAGGLEKLKAGSFSRHPSPLADYQALIAADFRQRPPASVAEAAQRIEQLTGLRRGPTQVRQFLKSLVLLCQS